MATLKPPVVNNTPTWLTKYRASLAAGRMATRSASAKRTVPRKAKPKKKPVLPAMQNPPPTSAYIPPGPEPGSYTPPGFDTTFGHTYGPVTQPEVDPPSLYDLIGDDQRRTYGLGVQPEVVESSPVLATDKRQTRQFDESPRPDDDQDYIAAYLETLFGEGTQVADDEEYYYPSYPGYPGGGSTRTAAQVADGHRPDWKLWSTFIQQTTWNV